MSQPFNSVADVRRFVDELNNPHCPVAIRTRELRAEREQQAQKKREAERQREEQQGAAARNPEAWYAWLDQRIAEHFQQRFDRDAEGNVGPLTAAIGHALGHTRAEIRKEFEAAIEKLREEFRVGMGRVPIAKVWDPDIGVAYRGDVVVHNGETFQALQDTGKTPAADHPHWILLARAGRAGKDADPVVVAKHVGDQLEPPLRDYIDEAVAKLPPAKDGARGPQGDRGARGASTPWIVAWTLDIARYRAVPTLSNGTQGAVLDLYPLFERFNAEAVLSALDQAMHDAARTKLLSPLG